MAVQDEVDIDQLARRVIAPDRVVPTRRISVFLRNLQHDLLSGLGRELIEPLAGQLDAAHARCDVE